MSTDEQTTDVAIVVDENMSDNELAQLQALHDDIITRMVSLAELEPLRAQQAFHTELNKVCPPEFIRSERGVDTLPISFVESMLDAYFVGNWSVENFHIQIVVNEIVGWLDLVCHHPVTGHTIRRMGSAAVQIMVHADSDHTNINNKKKNALEMGFPKLRAMCIKNAAKSLGKRFGRDLNRKHVAAAFEVVKTTTDVLDLIISDHQNSNHDDENE